MYKQYINQSYKNIDAHFHNNRASYEWRKATTTEHKMFNLSIELTQNPNLAYNLHKYKRSQEPQKTGNGAILHS